MLSSLVTNKTIHARIDRPSGIVDFRPIQLDPSEVMNDWVRNVNELLGLVEKTTHLIAKVRVTNRAWLNLGRRK